MATTHFTCNGCGRETAPSKEHFLHLAIGRVVLRNKQLTTEQMRARLRSGWFSQYRQIENPLKEPGRSLRLDGWIRNFLCEPCNRTWAKKLEENAGGPLYHFIHGEGSASLPVMRHWGWFFALKLWRYYRRNEALAEGHLYPFLRHLAAGNSDEIPPILVCKMGQKPLADKRWRFALLQGPQPRYWCFVVWGVAFFAVMPDAGGLPFETLELSRGLTRSHLPVVPRRYLSAFWMGHVA